MLNLNSYKCKYIMNNKNSEITFNRYNQSLSSYYIIRSRHDIAEILLKLALSTNQSLKVKKSNDYKKVSQKIIIKYKCYAYLRYAALPLISSWNTYLSGSHTNIFLKNKSRIVPDRMCMCLNACVIMSSVIFNLQR